MLETYPPVGKLPRRHRIANAPVRKTILSVALFRSLDLETTSHPSKRYPSDAIANQVFMVEKT